MSEIEGVANETEGDDSELVKIGPSLEENELKAHFETLGIRKMSCVIPPFSLDISMSSKITREFNGTMFRSVSKRLSRAGPMISDRLDRFFEEKLGSAEKFLIHGSVSKMLQTLSS